MKMISHARTGVPVLVLAIGLGACDQSTTDLIGEIDAAREGCTEEMLKASDEECIQMFERYAEMGEGALETYIGGMKALDEALRRRGGIQFDTAGIGRVFSDSSVFRDGGASPSELDPATAPYVSSAPSWEAGPGPSWSRQGEPGTDPRGLPDGRRPSSAEFRRPAPGEVEFDGGNPSVPSAAPRRSPVAAPRGTMLPPGERLRRPWIDDSEPDDAYYERRDPVTDLPNQQLRSPAPIDRIPAPYPRE